MPTLDFLALDQGHLFIMEENPCAVSKDATEVTAGGLGVKAVSGVTPKDRARRA